MSSERQIVSLLAQADRQRRAGNHAGAIALAERALALDPDRAQSHAALAFILLAANQPRAAKREIEVALRLRPRDPQVNYVAATVFGVQRKLEVAWSHCETMLAGSPAFADGLVLAAQLRAWQHQRAEAKELLRRALEVDPVHVVARARLARLELDTGNPGEAHRLIDEALRLDPGSVEAHIAAGHIALADGDTTRAEDHGRTALRENPNYRPALYLWTAIQAQRSRWLGVWWRWNVWLSRYRLITRFVIVGCIQGLARLLIHLTERRGHPDLAALVGLVSFVSFAYIVAARAVFDRMLRRALAPVKLQPRF